MNGGAVVLRTEPLLEAEHGAVKTHGGLDVGDVEVDLGTLGTGSPCSPTQRCQIEQSRSGGTRKRGCQRVFAELSRARRNCRVTRRQPTCSTGRVPV
jgi:hypothetical protein